MKMATSAGISKAVDLLAMAFATFRKSAELAGILTELLEPFTDDEVVQAAKRLIGSSTKAPSIADLVNTSRAISGPRTDTCPTAGEKHYVEYWDRPKHERDEIDKARRECMEMAKRLGMDMEAIFTAPEERPSPDDDEQDKYWKGR
jgi:hypothetical protein